MTAMTKHDAINAAMGLAEDIAQGRVKPTDLEQQAVADLRDLFGTVAGPDDPAWATQVDVARQVIALGALTADELSEWATVIRRRAGEQRNGSDPLQTLPETISLASEAHSPEAMEPDAEAIFLADVAPMVTPDPQPTLTVVSVPPSPTRRPDDQGYDPLRGWDAGGSRRS